MIKIINNLKYKTKIIISIIIIFIAANYLSYTVTNNNKTEIINQVLLNNAKKINTEYTILINQQKIMANTIYKLTSLNKKAMKIMSQAYITTNLKEKNILREKFYNILKDQYKIIKSSGVLQYHFVFPNNNSFIRFHKKSKYADNLNNVRKDFSFVHKTKKEIHGFSQGRTIHGFRNVYPLYFEKNYIGAMEVSFSTEDIQKYFTKINNLETHFLIDKNVFKVKQWKRDDIQLKYEISKENKNYLIAVNHKHKNTIKLASVLSEIDKNIKLEKQFSIYTEQNNGLFILSFIPIKSSVEKNIVAWIVSYEKNHFIHETINHSMLIRIILFFVFLILSYFIYTIIIQKYNLNINNIKIDEQKKIFELLFNDSNDGISLIRGNKFIDCNKSILNIFKFKNKEDFLGNELFKLSPKYQPDGQLSVKKATNIVRETFKNNKKTFEWVHKNALGVDFWVESTLTIMKLNSVNMLHIVVRDISEKKRLERESLLNNQLLSIYKNIVDESSIVSIANNKGIITYSNNKFTEISGYTQEELIGKNHSIVRHSDMPDSIFDELWTTIKDKRIWKGKLKNKKKDGSSYWVDVVIKPILDINGDITKYIALRQDITKEEEYKELLKSTIDDKTKSLDSNLNYITQYEEANNKFTAILKTDTKNIITFANEEFCSISGFTQEELIGTNCQDLRHEEHIKRGDCVRLIETLSKKNHVSIVFTNVAKDGSLYYVDTIVYPICDTNSVIVEHLHLMHDVSELKEIHHEVEETQKELVYKMGEIGESRSKETGNHVKRVASYSKELALLYGLTQHEANVLFIASPMHDIGKVAIPDAILKKQGKLTPDEFEIMKEHAEIGYSVLKGSSREILKAAAIVANEHHEKWDGSGYPNSLSGEDIHIFGRITAIADVFDALGSDRVYKKAWEDSKIFKLLIDGKAKHFDPKLVDLFLDNKSIFLDIRDKYKD